MARGKPTSRSAARKHAKQTKPRSSGSPTYPRLNDDDREAVDRAVRQLTESEPFRLIGQATAIAPTKRDEDDPLLTRNRRINSENWRADVEVRFILWQRRRRTWISFREIAEWYAERSDRYDAAELDRAYGILQHDLFVGDFEEGGRTQVRYLHPSVPKAWMTRDMLQRAIDTHPAETVRLHYLSRCWIPRRMFDRRLAKHGLPSSPARFEPQEQLEAASARTEAPKIASKAEIKRAIEAVYDAAKAEGDKPPNIKELADMVQPQLKALGRLVSKSQIRKIGAAYKTRRRPRGKTVRSEQQPD